MKLYRMYRTGSSIVLAFTAGINSYNCSSGDVCSKYLQDSYRLLREKNPLNVKYYEYSIR